MGNNSAQMKQQPERKEDTPDSVPPKENTPDNIPNITRTETYQLEAYINMFGEWSPTDITKHYYTDTTIIYSFKIQGQTILINNPENIMIEQIAAETRFSNIRLAPLGQNIIPMTWRSQFSTGQIQNIIGHYSVQKQKAYMISLVNDGSRITPNFCIYKSDISTNEYTKIVTISDQSTTSTIYRMSIDSINDILYLFSYTPEIKTVFLNGYNLETYECVYTGTKQESKRRNTFGAFYTSCQLNHKSSDIDYILKKTIFCAVSNRNLVEFDDVIENLRYSTNPNKEYIFDSIYCSTARRRYTFGVIVGSNYTYSSQKCIAVIYYIDDGYDERKELMKIEFTKDILHEYRIFKPTLIKDGYILIFDQLRKVNVHNLRIIDTIKNKIIQCEVHRQFYGIKYEDIDCFCDRKNKKLCFVSGLMGGIQIVDLGEIVPFYVYSREIVNGYINRIKDVFIPETLVNIIVSYIS